MGTIEIILLVLGSATFGAIIGKLLDAYLLNRINDKYERMKWLRQTKFESFAKIAEEILSLGFKSSLRDNLWKFKSLSASTILLIEDEHLKKAIEEIIENIIKIENDLPSLVKSSLPDDFKIELPNGEIATKKNLEVGAAISAIEKDAIVIVEKLGKDLRNT